MHQGEPYLVDSLDLASRTAHVVRNDGAYYTQAKDITDIAIRSIHRSRVAGG